MDRGKKTGQTRSLLRGLNGMLFLVHVHVIIQIAFILISSLKSFQQQIIIIDNIHVTQMILDIELYSMFVAT